MGRSQTAPFKNASPVASAHGLRGQKDFKLQRLHGAKVRNTVTGATLHQNFRGASERVVG